mmetsp:Transcript_91156/g.133231  ORF Transcript_91156/g.133231 Transcript_91156/m.133231 type:complete len:431 (+) Transcript_91156:133-1425(+)
MRKSLISIANARMLFGRALFRSIGITHARRSLHYGRDVSFQSRNRGCSLFNCRRRNLVFKQEAKQTLGHQLIAASKNGQAEKVQELITELVGIGNTSDLQDTDGWSALMYASLDGHTKVLDNLISARANLDLQEKQGMTALMMGAGMGQTEVADKLIAAGAKLDLQDKDGKTALILARENCNTKITGKLISFDALDTDTRFRVELVTCDDFLKVAHDPKKGSVVCVQKNKELKKGDVVSQQHQMAVVLKYAMGATATIEAQMEAIRKVLPDIQANPKAVKGLMRLQSQVGREQDAPHGTLTAARVHQATQMNAFGMQDKNTNKVTLLLWEPNTVSGSVFGHACKPNARLIIDKTPTLESGVFSRTWKIQILEDIASSKQVTINYRNVDWDRESVDIRRDEIKTIWGFKCECDLCVEQHAKKSTSRGSNQA